MILNIRGANGSGKTTIARAFITPGAVEVDLHIFQNDKGKTKKVIGYHDPVSPVIVVGSYKTACGGMDGIPSFEVSRNAIRSAQEKTENVICEGVLASTVFGSWADFAKVMKLDYNSTFAFAYLDTPLEVCLKRIYERNGGKKIKEELVKSKVSAIAATRKKALSAGFVVYDLPYEDAIFATTRIITGTGDPYLAQR